VSFVTYKLKQRPRSVGKGATESRMGDVEAVVKQDHNEARGQVNSEIVAYRLASLIGVEAAFGALVAHDTGLKYASLVISIIATDSRVISSKADIERVTKRYPLECARIAVFDLWVGNDDRLGNLRANVTRSSDHLIVALDHGRTLLGSGNDPIDALKWLERTDFPTDHPFVGRLVPEYCQEILERIQGLDARIIADVCILNDTCGAVMLPEQADLADLLDRRREWLPDLVAKRLCV